MSSGVEIVSMHHRHSRAKLAVESSQASRSGFSGFSVFSEPVISPSLNAPWDNTCLE
jgi:hypothetical protein